MRQFLTGADLFAQVMMLRGVDRRAVVLVEGASDCTLLDLHLDPTTAQSVPGYGKNSVILACRLAEQEGAAAVAGVVDADFDVILGLTNNYPGNVHATEYYDLETDVLVACPDILDRILATFSDRERVAADGDVLATGGGTFNVLL